MIKTTYVTVAVDIDDGVPTLNLTDDGEPGDWGNTYTYNPETEDGSWDNDAEAQAIAYEHVYNLLGPAE